jgi:hypothetical protein
MSTIHDFVVWMAAVMYSKPPIAILNQEQGRAGGSMGKLNETLVSSSRKLEMARYIAAGVLTTRTQVIFVVIHLMNPTHAMITVTDCADRRERIRDKDEKGDSFIR